MACRSAIGGRPAPSSVVIEMGCIFRRTKRLGDDTISTSSNSGASLSRRVWRRLRPKQPRRWVVPA